MSENIDMSSNISSALATSVVRAALMSDLRNRSPSVGLLPESVFSCSSSSSSSSLLSCVPSRRESRVSGEHGENENTQRDTPPNSAAGATNDAEHQQSRSATPGQWRIHLPALEARPHARPLSLLELRHDLLHLGQVQRRRQLPKIPHMQTSSARRHSCYGLHRELPQFQANDSPHSKHALSQTYDSKYLKRCNLKALKFFRLVCGFNCCVFMHQYPRGFEKVAFEEMEWPRTTPRGLRGNNKEIVR